MMKKLLFLLPILFVQISFGQEADSYIYTGKLIDAYSGENIKDANVVITGRDFLGRSNFLGYFQAVGAPGQNIYISHVNYELSELDLPYSTQEFLIKLTPKYHDIGTLNPLNEFSFTYDKSDYDLKMQLRDQTTTDPTLSELKAYFPGGDDEFVQYLGSSSPFTKEESLLLHDESIFFTIHDSGKLELDSTSFSNKMLASKLEKSIASSPSWLPASQWNSKITVKGKVDFFVDEFIMTEQDLVSQKPSFQNGIDALYNEINERIEYPLDALYELKEGKAIVSFTIDANGNLSDIEIIEDPGYGMAKELIRVLNSISGFIPATNRESIESIRVLFPYKFKLAQQEEKLVGDEELGVDESQFTIPIATDFDPIKRDYTSFESALKANPRIEDLTINNQGLKEIPTLINQFRMLQNLDVSSNNIRKISPLLFEIEPLKRIYLSNNLVREIPADIGKSDLLVFNVANNQIKEFPEAILGCKKLKVLDLSGNMIKQIPAEINNLKNLRALYINELPIDSLPLSIGKMRKLKYIFIKDTQITEQEIGVYIARFPDKQIIY